MAVPQIYCPVSKLSISIPVYNQNITKLASILLEEIKDTGASVELVVMDDGSDEDTKKNNRWLKDSENVQYRELEKNVGRAAIRNKLAGVAKGTHLLFLDDDSEISQSGFIANYLRFTQQKTVICGGRNYPSELPGRDYTLHWHYGRKKESRPARQRNLNPHDSFHSNNFLIPKALLKKIPFDESLTQYGHEDTLLGYHLRSQNAEVAHIDNPVIHAHLESNKEFLEKTQLALQNLKLLYERQDVGFNNSVKMLRGYQKLKNLGLLKPMHKLFKRKRKSWEAHLLNSENPSMLIFNQYKLGYLASLR